ncbi:MAG TPA: putative metal-binding motif-containing protein, partial [Minicystis sp.]|nr:putative metal-binding motif-containing protein [Minicystis sp.]
MKRLVLSAGAAGLVSLLAAGAARASTGLCDQTAATQQACIDAIQMSGGVVNAIFTDANGNDALHLPAYGVLYNQWGPGCTLTSFAGCAGYDTGNADCPGQYACDGTVTNTFANASARLNGPPDHLWWHPCRFASRTVDANGCLTAYTCLSDGDASNYNPWEGAVFDLGGPSNKVAIFATNDHGPQPCESLEYTVFLTDNPMSKDAPILDPSTQGVDPTKWNRAVLKTVYTHGWYDTGRAFNASCGDTNDYPVEQDSFVQVFSLPCGITFRYAAIVAGNDGLDFPACQYASQEAELDAVAGLTEEGAGVCPDADGDHYVDCNCPGHPPVCDCDDGDPTVHPGATEACDADKDYNCDGNVGTMCPANTVCFDGRCDDACSGGENPFCPAGATCKETPNGRLCVPGDCSGGCPDGTACSGGQCVPTCDQVVCPGDQVCQDGHCFDPCDPNLIQCPPGQSCVNGKCEFPCNCYAGDLGCTDQMGTVCDRSGSNECVPPMCAGVSCP